MTTIEEQILDFLDSQHFSSSQARFSQASTGIPDELKESVNNVDVEALINVLDSVLSNLEGPLKGVVNTIINAINEGEERSLIIHGIFHHIMKRSCEGKISEERMTEMNQIIVSKVIILSLPSLK